MKKGDVIRQKCVNTTFYLTGILAHKVNNICYHTVGTYNSTLKRARIQVPQYCVPKSKSVLL